MRFVDRKSELAVMYEDLVKKSQLVDWRKDARIERYVLFSRAGFTESMRERAKKEGVLLVHGDRLCS